MKVPDYVNWSSGADKIKPRYLAHGFKALGIGLNNRNKLHEEIQESFIYPFELVYGEKKVKVYLDIVSAINKLNVALMDGEAFYFKVHTKKEDLGKYPRFYPMAQSAGSVKFPTRLLRYRRSGFPEMEHDVFGIFANSDAGLRVKVVDMVRRQNWKSKCWILPKYDRGLPSSEFQGPKLPFEQYIDELARSRIVIALPGGVRKSWLTFRHVEAWGFGRCCVTTNPTNRVVLGDPKGIWVEFKEDLSDFVEKINHCLSNSMEREMMALNGRRYYYDYLTPRAHARYIIETVSQEIFHV